MRGDLQPPNDRDKYAATLAARIFRCLMAVAVKFGLKAVQLDAINTFINGILDETVYTYQPEGFGVPGKVCWLLRALYGLRRSPLIWLNEFSKTLKELGLTQVPESPCLFTSGRLVVFFYVDDVVILYPPEYEADYITFKEQLLNRYEFKDLGDLKWFLGIRVIRSETKLWLCQDSYIEKIAASFNLIKGPRFNTPMDTVMNAASANLDQATDQQIHLYQALVGSIGYAVINTRPDSARANNKLAEFLTNPSPEHIEAAQRIIRYLYDTRYLAIEYSKEGGSDQVNPDLHCSADAAYADDTDTRKSTEGFLFKLFGGPIDWHSSKQKAVTRSSTEAELLALSHASTQLYWWRRFFDQIKLQLDEYKVLCDNQQTIRIVSTPAIKLATKLKHIDVHQHWMRQEVAEKRLQIEWISTDKMTSDGFTKALTAQKHQAFIRQLGLVDIRHLIEESSLN